MSKLTKHQKRERKLLLAEFMELGGQLFSDEEYGVTVAIMPVNPCFKDHKFALVSTAFCSYQDTWSRKYGEYLALVRIMYQGEYIKMPVPNTSHKFEFMACRVMELYDKLANFY